MLSKIATNLISFLRRYAPFNLRTHIKTLLKNIVNFLFHTLYFDDRKWKFKWLGVNCWQNSFDMWIKQEIISEIQPDYIIETGTSYGGTALFYSMLLEQIGNGHVISIDVDAKLEEASKYQVFNKRCTVLKGSSVSDDIHQQVLKRVKGGKAIVILDSEHSKEHVLREMELYAPLVSVNSYLIVEDTNLNGHPIEPNFGPGPYEAVQEFLKNNNNFIVDKDKERLPITFFPSGYLKRIR